MSEHDHDNPNPDHRTTDRSADERPPELTPDEKPDAKDQDRPQIRERLMVLFTGVIAFFAMVQAGSAILQWREMRAQLEMTRDSNRLSQRAWITVSKIADFKLTAGKGLFTKAELRNVGHIPAMKVSGVAVGSVSAPGTPLLFAGEVPNLSAAVIGPNGTAGIRLNIPPLNEQMIEMIKSGARTLTLYGVLTYTDPIKTEGQTLFCAFYLPETKGFNYCAEGNDIK